MLDVFSSSLHLLVSIYSVDIEFRYIGDILARSGDTGYAVTARIRTGLRKSGELSFVLCKRGLSLKLKRQLYKAFVRSLMCYKAECTE